MSAIIHLMGRVTKDPVMQQGRNNGTEYISLDLATSQRSQNAQNNPENPYESVFYQCYLNKHLAERLIKAGVAGRNPAGAPPYNGDAATPGAGGYQNPGP